MIPAQKCCVKGIFLEHDSSKTFLWKKRNLIGFLINIKIVAGFRIGFGSLYHLIKCLFDFVLLIISNEV